MLPSAAKLTLLLPSLQLLYRRRNTQVKKHILPSLLTAATINNTPSYYFDCIIDYLTNIYYLRSTALSAIKKVIIIIICSIYSLMRFPYRSI